jgi:hypothetical protein
MFRRPRNRPVPVRFPRQHKRTRETETPFEFTQKIENGLSAILGFFADVVRVIYRMFRHPLNFDRYADPKGNLAPSVRPFTFLALTAFIATNAVRALTTSMLLRAAHVRTLQRARDAGRGGVSEHGFATQASSGRGRAAHGLAGSAVERALPDPVPARLQRPGGAGRGRALNLCLYIVGLQYLLLAFSVSWFISGDLFNKA